MSLPGERVVSDVENKTDRGQSAVLGEGLMKGIIFSHNIDKVLDGSKSQTRRVIKDDFEIKLNGDYYIRKKGLWHQYHSIHDVIEKYARYKKGETVYLKETWADGNKEYKIRYRADFLPDNEPTIKWNNAMFMPEIASRCKLKILDVRVERLQDITENDIYDEGLRCPVCDVTGYSGMEDSSTAKECSNCNTVGYKNNINDFRELWDSINKEYTWESNPYVWVYKFKREVNHEIKEIRKALKNNTIFMKSIGKKEKNNG